MHQRVLFLESDLFLLFTVGTDYDYHYDDNGDNHAVGTHDDKGDNDDDNNGNKCNNIKYFITYWHYNFLLGCLPPPICKL